MIASFNTVNIFSEMKNLEVTVKDGEHVEGSGAMRVKGAQSASFVLKNPVDISQYVVESGKLHISVYINNPDLLTGATYFYLTSSAMLMKSLFIGICRNISLPRVGTKLNCRSILRRLSAPLKPMPLSTLLLILKSRRRVRLSYLTICM